MRISDWSSDVCSSDLPIRSRGPVTGLAVDQSLTCRRKKRGISILSELPDLAGGAGSGAAGAAPASFALGAPRLIFIIRSNRSEEHTSELQSLMRSSYAVFCLKKNTYSNSRPTETIN